MIQMNESPELRRVRRVALGDFVHRSALKFPERIAVVDGDTRLSYRQFDARSSRFAHYLIGAVGSGRQVGMLCANSADMAVAYNGIHKSGNVWVPVNIRLDVAAIDYILRHAEVSAVVVDEAYHAAPGIADMLARLGVPLVVTMAGQAGSAIAGATTLAQAEHGQGAELPGIEIDGDAPALIMYTSGTIGHPKGAVHSHASVAASVMGNMAGFGITEQDVFSGVLPLFHCAQHCLVATVHAAGACVVLLRGFVPDEVRASILKEKYTAFTGLPMMYGALLADPAFRCDEHMRMCIYAMAPIPKPLIPLIAERMSANVMLATGQTEMYPGTMTFRPLDHPDLDANYWGVSLPHNETAVMDDDGRLLGEGQPGEIVHRGANAMLGYFKDPEATAAAQKFGWHHTGDLGMWGPGGQMMFLDRKKDMIKTGGENVASVKVEAVLLSHPAVAAAGVIGMPHPRWTEAVCAFVMKKPGAEVDEAALLAHCRAHLGDFEVPKLVHFVDQLPATSTGKVQKHRLRQQFAELAARAFGE
ncbi:MAG TPA: AMP-binding protein [Ottowia sp.]|uniref:class I adenylate-forming enzyme family protein n=1 Tax=Ottowia sp. TaxID=1898956 RepID=UPI002BF7913B|nr:AMP-binding protein [Ottowia sp.]HMN21314.1 AMP-binding protein [Ottowia sp.]